jgi:hypothetical protein
MENIMIITLYRSAARRRARSAGITAFYEAVLLGFYEDRWMAIS